MASHPTNKARNQRQKLKRKLARLREDLQLAGQLPTVPAGGVRDERVPVGPDVPMPYLIRRALAQGWDVPDANKPKLVDEMMAFIEDPHADKLAKVLIITKLLELDRAEWRNT